MTQGEEKAKILIVDDSKLNRAILSDMLIDRYDILEASDGVQAVEIINKYGSKISLILLDVVMPNLDGFEVMAIMNKYHWIEEIPVIMISAENSHSIIERAYELGATDYINRPFDDVIVRRRVINTIMLYTKQKSLVSLVADQMYESEKNNTLMVSILSHIVEFRNGESGLHVLHIGTMTELLLRRLFEKTNQYNLNHNMISLISKASAFHDIGKIAINEEILNKPGRLTPDEFEIIKTHSLIGANMLEDLPIYKDDKLVNVAYGICRWHHERYDGKGYPDGLVGDQIPISAQVVSLADAYDALISERVYKKAYSHEKALEMILNGECGAFNPLLLECLQDIAGNIKEELKIDSYSKFNKREIEAITEQLMSKKNIASSSRTLNLLEEERMKFKFFAEMSSEIQFEYTRIPFMITLTNWGAERLHVPQVIIGPKDNEAFLSIVKYEDMIQLDNILSLTSKNNPVIEFETDIYIDGMWQRKQLICRAMWTNDEEEKYNGCIGKIVELNSEAQQIKRLKKLNMYDLLTNLLNASYAKKTISKILAAQSTNDFIMMIIDLNYFKSVNIKRGHLFGDRILKYIAEKLKQSLYSEDDIVARVGGDEFLIFTKMHDNVDGIIQNVFDSVEGECDGFQIRINIGVAFTDTVGHDYDTLYHCADIALTNAKNKGCSSFSYYDNEMHNVATSISDIDNK